MDELENTLNKVLPGIETPPKKTMVARDRITEELENAIAQTSIKHVVLELAKIARNNDEREPYFNWEKDAKLLELGAHYLEN